MPTAEEMIETPGKRSVVRAGRKIGAEGGAGPVLAVARPVARAAADQMEETALTPTQAQALNINFKIPKIYPNSLYKKV